MMLAIQPPLRPAGSCVISGQAIHLDCSGALFIPELSMLIVSDMHLEKGTSWAHRGIFLPPYDSTATLSALNEVVRHFMPSKLVFLGDSFHDVGGPVRLSDMDRAMLDQICADRDTFWVTGNHDPEIPDDLPGSIVTEFAVGSLNFTHIPQKGALGQISGHLHPVATVKGRGRTIRRRCFIADENRMIVPSFGAYTGGVNIRDNAFDGLFAKGALSVHIIGDRAIHTFPGSICGR